MTPPDEVRPRRGRRLSAQERELWREVAGSLKPLRRSPKPLPDAADPLHSAALANAPRDKPVAATSRAPQPLRSKPAAVAAPPPPSAMIARRERRHIARGKIAIDARVDLHGLTQAQAHGVLLRFLHRAQSDGCRVVLVITGKGKAGNGTGEFSDGERGVLRRQVPLWLELPEFRLSVLQFDQADIGHGGDGALYVRLRRAV